MICSLQVPQVLSKMTCRHFGPKAGLSTDAMQKGSAVELEISHFSCYNHSNPCNVQVKERTTDTYERGKGAVEGTAEEARRAAWDAVERTEAAAAAATERAQSATGQVLSMSQKADFRQ